MKIPDQSQTIVDFLTTLFEKMNLFDMATKIIKTFKDKVILRMILKRVLESFKFLPKNKYVYKIIFNSNIRMPYVDEK